MYIYIYICIYMLLLPYCHGLALAEWIGKQRLSLHVHSVLCVFVVIPISYCCLSASAWPASVWPRPRYG